MERSLYARPGHGEARCATFLSIVHPGANAAQSMGQGTPGHVLHRGEVLFKGKADCARCHVPPLFTEPGWNMHKPGEVGIDDFQAMRSPDGMYRTTPLKGLWSHQKGGFFHDGRFPTLLDVVNHYNTFLNLNLSDQEKNDVVEYLKSL